MQRPATQRQKVSFQNARGLELSASLELPEGEPRAFALFAHCFTCSKNVAAATRIASGLCERGYGVLRFDFTGLGNSEGDFANTNFSSNVQDVVAAAAYLREHHAAPELLVGHSLGGAAVLMAADDIPESKAVATIGTPSSPNHVKSLLRQDLQEIEDEGSAEVELAGRPFRIEKQFVRDLERHDLAREIRRMKRALLIYHAPFDELVSIDHAAELFQAALHPKSFISLDGADHLLTRKRDAEFVASTLAAWAARYVEEDAEEEDEGEGDHETSAAPELPHGEVVVKSAGGLFKQEIRAGRHVFVGDEPVSVGGEDAGPTPYDYLLASLGTCTAMTLQMYARHKQLALESVEVRLRQEKIHAKDCENCESETGKVDRIERVLRVTGDLTEAQRARLLEIADRCPVHRTLEGEKEILTRYV